MDEAPSSSGSKRKKTTSFRDPNAPKRPVPAYIYFCNEQRQKLRSERPDITFYETTKQLGAMWNALPADRKQPYVLTAEKDKARYVREFDEYKRSDSYRRFRMQSVENAKATKRQKMDAHAQLAVEGSSNDLHKSKSKAMPLSMQQFITGTDIPVFTEQFLMHNREVENELRKLRHANADLEEQNAVLSRHIETLHGTVQRAHSETQQLQQRNEVLRTHLKSLREELSALQGFPCP